MRASSGRNWPRTRHFRHRRSERQSTADDSCPTAGNLAASYGPCSKSVSARQARHTTSLHPYGKLLMPSWGLSCRCTAGPLHSCVPKSRMRRWFRCSPRSIATSWAALPRLRRSAPGRTVCRCSRPTSSRPASHRSRRSSSTNCPSPASVLTSCSVATTRRPVSPRSWSSNSSSGAALTCSRAPPTSSSSTAWVSDSTPSSRSVDTAHTSRTSWQRSTPSRSRSRASPTSTTRLISTSKTFGRWSQARAQTKTRLITLRPPYSDKALHRAFPTQTQDVPQSIPSVVQAAQAGLRDMRTPWRFGQLVRHEAHDGHRFAREPRYHPSRICHRPSGADDSIAA